MFKCRYSKYMYLGTWITTRSNLESENPLETFANIYDASYQVSIASQKI